MLLDLGGNLCPVLGGVKDLDEGHGGADYFQSEVKIEKREESIWIPMIVVLVLLEYIPVPFFLHADDALSTGCNQGHLDILHSGGLRQQGFYPFRF